MFLKIFSFFRLMGLAGRLDELLRTRNPVPFRMEKRLRFPVLTKEELEAASAAAVSSAAVNTAPWLKVDFHLHSSEDPYDQLDYPATDLLRRAKELGFGALAITLHGQVLSKPEVFCLAQELGLLLIPGAEVRLEGADVVVLNISEAEAAGLRTFADLRALRQARGAAVFIFAPHPYYVLGGSMGNALLMQHMELFDAIETSHFYTHGLDPNKRARAVAARFAKPLLATSDAHRLDFFGEHSRW